MTDPRIEYLQTLLHLKEQNDLIVAGANMVVAGGVEGIQTVAEQAPELILETIRLLCELINDTHVSFLGLAESYMSIGDDIEKIIREVKE